MNMEPPPEIADAFNFERDRRRPDGEFNTPAGGFSTRPTGFTFWLPAPAVETLYVFRDGEPRPETVGTRTTLAVAALRQRVALSFTRTGPDGDGPRVDTAFLAYAATVLRMNYTLTDDELTMLLAGRRWHKDVTTHLLAGDDTAAAMARVGLLDPAPAGMIAAADPTPALPLPRPAPAPEPPARRPRWSPFRRRA